RAPVTAQSGQLQEVRAAAFVVTGPEGIMLGRLGSGGLGNGNPSLYDDAGRQRWQMNGVGGMSAFGSEGMSRFQAGYQPIPGPEESHLGPQGIQPINGVMLDANGSVGTLP